MKNHYKITTIVTILMVFLVKGIFGQGSFPTKSVLADGQIFKFSVPSTGVYKITRAMLTTAGVPSTVDPRNIKIYSNKGSALPEKIAASILNDLVEIPIEIEGQEDGKFDASDVIYCYVEGANNWIFGSSGWNYHINTYDTKNFFYLKISTDAGKRITTKNYNPTSTTLINEYELKQQFEEEKINLLTREVNTQGSGKRWFGELQRSGETKSISGVDLTKYTPNKLVNIKLAAAGRASNTGNIEYTIGGKKIEEFTFGVNLFSIESNYASLAEIDQNLVITDPAQGIKVKYVNAANTGEAWVDYARTVGLASAKYEGKQMILTHPATLQSDGFYQISNVPSTLRAWRVDDLSTLTAFRISDSKVPFEQVTQPSQILLWQPENTSEPSFVSKVDNQNLHEINQADMVIIYADQLKKSAERLADHRTKTDKFKVVVASTSSIFNEFSSGKVDPSGIRNFLKMIYDRSSTLKYVLLIGDATYDYKHITNSTSTRPLVPTFQSEESIHPVLAFPTDDYYGLMSNNEGGDLVGSLELSVGRIPVNTEADAEGVVDKIIRYDTDPDRFGSWRTNIGFMADDEDYNIHLLQADRIADRVGNRYPAFNIKKTYLDAFQQVSTPGGQRYPDVSFDINTQINQGLLTMCYLGHGGPSGLTQERVVQVKDINEWSNVEKPVLIITATCSFTGFDNPQNSSPGELALANKSGGAIALFSTVRAVYSSENERITSSVFDFIYNRSNNEAPRLGDIMLKAKNFQGQDTLSINTRKFGLFGDPAQKLALPALDVKLNKINDSPVETFKDTLSAFDKVKLQGSVTNIDGSVATSFNGMVAVTIFDKKTEISTLKNDADSYEYRFGVYKNVLFKGLATVVNGTFELSFVIPIDINYQIGKTKIQLYAFSKDTDGFGVFEGLTVGGETRAVVGEDKKPTINGYINDVNFRDGGITNNQPKLVLALADDFGIKVTGNSIGHDLTATLTSTDGKYSEKFILNDFYQSSLDDYRKGNVIFQLPKLDVGTYTIKAKAYDIGNNSAETTINFEVVDQDVDRLLKTYNYPNPFVEQTNFVLEHDFNNSDTEINLRIFSMEGKMVRNHTIKKTSIGSLEPDIDWDGKNDFGKELAKGIYLYKIIITAPALNKSRESELGKIIKI